MTEKAKTVISEARKHLGKPYKWVGMDQVALIVLD
ncbi:hypothetical protein BER37_003931 [Clostridioides difficile]|nr:hypothetical protein BER37_003931 [Clostridioides difficile]